VLVGRSLASGSGSERTQGRGRRRRRSASRACPPRSAWLEVVGKPRGTRGPSTARGLRYLLAELVVGPMSRTCTRIGSGTTPGAGSSRRSTYPRWRPGRATSAWTRCASTASLTKRRSSGPPQPWSGADQRLSLSQRRHGRPQAPCRPATLGEPDLARVESERSTRRCTACEPRPVTPPRPRPAAPATPARPMRSSRCLPRCRPRRPAAETVISADATAARAG
jgi:hypothetical protein